MRKVVFIALVLGFMSMGSVAEAEDRDVRFHGLGPRVGFSIDPNQFVFGGHADFGDIFPHTNLLVPVIEVGVGDNFTISSIGADLLFRFTDRWGVWTPYMGGEMAFLIANHTGDGGGDNTELGLSGIFGVEKVISEKNRFAAEVKFEIIDAPSVKLLAIWAFGH